MEQWTQYLLLLLVLLVYLLGDAAVNAPGQDDGDRVRRILLTV